MHPKPITTIPEACAAFRRLPFVPFDWTRDSFMKCAAAAGGLTPEVLDRLDLEIIGVMLLSRADRKPGRTARAFVHLGAVNMVLPHLSLLHSVLKWDTETLRGAIEQAATTNLTPLARACLVRCIRGEIRARGEEPPPL